MELTIGSFLDFCNNIITGLPASNLLPGRRSPNKRWLISPLSAKSPQCLATHSKGVTKALSRSEALADPGPAAPSPSSPCFASASLLFPKRASWGLRAGHSSELEHAPPDAGRFALLRVSAMLSLERRRPPGVTLDSERPPLRPTSTPRRLLPALFFSLSPTATIFRVVHLLAYCFLFGPRTTHR